MTTAVDRLLAQMHARGLSVVPGSEPGQLILRGPKEEQTPAVMAALKAFKPQLLELFGRPREVKPADPDPEPESTGDR